MAAPPASIPATLFPAAPQAEMELGPPGSPTPGTIQGRIVTLDVMVVQRYCLVMIISFKCRDTAKLADGCRVKRFVNFERVALRKIRPLQAASQLGDLKVPPGNMLEPLLGDRNGQHSIRINKQYRVCFRWSDAGAEDVEIVDYH